MSGLLALRNGEPLIFGFQQVRKGEKGEVLTGSGLRGMRREHKVLLISMGQNTAAVARREGDLDTRRDGLDRLRGAIARSSQPERRIINITTMNLLPREIKQLREYGIVRVEEAATGLPLDGQGINRTLIDSRSTMHNCFVCGRMEQEIKDGRPPFQNVLIIEAKSDCDFGQLSALGARVTLQGDGKIASLAACKEHKTNLLFLYRLFKAGSIMAGRFLALAVYSDMQTPENLDNGYYFTSWFTGNQGQAPCFACGAEARHGSSSFLHGIVNSADFASLMKYFTRGKPISVDQARLGVPIAEGTTCLQIGACAKHTANLFLLDHLTRLAGTMTFVMVARTMDYIR